MLAHAPHIEATMTTSQSEGSRDSKCPKCSDNKKSGALSCCARGGSWFKNCGDAGDSKFDHTWAEGIQACKSKLCSEFKLSVMYRDGDCVVWWTSRHWN